MIKTYVKDNANEDIQVGDLISVLPNGRIHRSYQNYSKRPDTKIIGICINVDNDRIDVQNEGIVDINVIGMLGIGCKVTASEEPGKGRILKYVQEEDMFNIRTIGKIIELYNDLNKAKVLLNIE